MSVIALIPAKLRSTGCVGKNFRQLGGIPLFEHAVRVAIAVGLRPIVSADSSEWEWEGTELENAVGWINRPDALAQDDTPMLSVVQHALEQIPGPPGQVIVLLQPTQPFRKPEHVKAAIDLLQSSGADSVVSVVELPKTHAPEMACWIGGMSGYLCPFDMKHGLCGGEPRDWSIVPSRRQETGTWYRRDGTVYAFRRSTVEAYGHIYGAACRPLIIPPEDSCELDTEADWIAVERRWQERHGA